MNEEEKNLSAAEATNLQPNAATSQEINAETEAPSATNVIVATADDIPLTTSEIFFKEEAKRLRQRFLNTSFDTENEFQYLLRQLEMMKNFHSHLELPWHEYIPIMYNAFALYLRNIENKKEANNTLKLTSDLMACVAFLSKAGNLIANTVGYYDKQINEIKKLPKKGEGIK